MHTGDIGWWMKVQVEPESASAKLWGWSMPKSQGPRKRTLYARAPWEAELEHCWHPRIDCVDVSWNQSSSERAICCLFGVSCLHVYTEPLQPTSLFFHTIGDRKYDLSYCCRPRVSVYLWVASKL
eukprot:GHUV01026894.1.p2 GENE.GHUV01026894.1~~GHUV01026894.1.p2  ORF type:complete len:125 (+),score=11.89 GHUV01026894.1:87-461(+)